jgi:hypothetical protein
MTWLTGRLCAFDTESTGVDTSTDRIVSACVAFVGGGEPAEFHEFLIDPGIEIPDSATKIHGITTEHAREHGSSRLLAGTLPMTCHCWTPNLRDTCGIRSCAAPSSTAWYWTRRLTDGAKRPCAIES